MRSETSRMSAAFAEVFVGDGGEGGGVFFGDLVEGVFGGDLFPVDELRHLVDQRRVFEDEQVRVENAGVLRAHALTDLALDLENLVAGLGEGLLEPAQLPGQFRLGEFAAGDGGVIGPVEDKDFSTADAGGDGDSRSTFSPS